MLGGGYSKNENSVERPTNFVKPYALIISNL